MNTPNKDYKGKSNEGLVSFIEDNEVDVFEPSYQNKFIKVFTEDRVSWCQQIIDILFPEYFDGYQKILINYQIEYFKKYRLSADYNELKDIINDNEKDILVREHLYALVEKIQNIELEHQKKQVVKDRAYEFFKSRKVKNTIIKLAMDWKRNKFESMKKELEDALKAGEPKDAGHDYMLDVEKRMKQDNRNPVSMLPGLDEQIGGGIASEELGVIMAPTGGGKSMMLVRFAVSALRSGKKVIYYTLELSEDAVAYRFDACLNGIFLKNVRSYKEKIKETIKELQKTKSGLKIKKYADGTATVNTFYSHLDWLKCNEDFVPDIIIVDYADNMRSLEKSTELRHNLISIYRDLRAMAFELKCPVLTASQTNAKGYEKTGENLELGMMSEATGKSNICDLILAVGRDNDELKAKKATIKILKNRNGEHGRSYKLKFDTAFVNICMEEGENFNSIDNKNKSMIIGRDPLADSRNISDLLSNQGFA